MKSRYKGILGGRRNDRAMFLNLQYIIHFKTEENK